MEQKPEYRIRNMEEWEYPRLRDFLYEAIFQSDAAQPFPRSVLDQPALRIYFEDFGLKEDDFCLCAESGGKIRGAVWIRRICGYGYVGDAVPELAIALYKEYRGFGIGTELMKRMLELLQRKGYCKVSLSVQKANLALNMYRRLGFRPVRETPEEYVMEYDFEKKGVVI